MFDEIFNNLIKLNQIFDKNKKVIIFGTGLVGRNTFCVLNNLAVKTDFFVDNNLSLEGSILFSIPIKNPASLMDEKKDDIIILIASMYYEEISAQLVKMGYEENIHYYQVFRGKVLKKTTYFSEFGFSVGKYSFGFHQFCTSSMKSKLKSIGAFC